MATIRATKAGQLGTFEAVSEGAESCLGLRSLCPGTTSSPKPPQDASPALSRKDVEFITACILPYLCCKIEAIGKSPGAKPNQQMRLDLI